MPSHKTFMIIDKEEAEEEAEEEQANPSLDPHENRQHHQGSNMTNKWHVYMTKDGRISLAGLSSAKCKYLADAIIDSFLNVK